MILISHRGNLCGAAPSKENTPGYIQEALDLGYEVEIDVWHQSDGWYLGHDEPEYKLEEQFLLKDKLWCHAKNLHALNKLLELNVMCFWHQSDRYTLTSNNFIWTFPGQPLSAASICVMPERFSVGSQDLSFCAGVCSDFIAEWK